MPSIKDYVSGYGVQNPTYDGEYLDAGQADPKASYTPDELDFEEEGFNLKGNPFIAPADAP